MCLSLEICGLIDLVLALVVLTLYPLRLLSSMCFFLKLSGMHVICMCIGEMWQERIRAGMFFGMGCTVPLKSLARFENCRISSFWKGALSTVTEGMACLAALIDVLLSETPVLYFCGMNHCSAPKVCLAMVLLLYVWCS